MVSSHCFCIPVWLEGELVHAQYRSAKQSIPYYFLLLTVVLHNTKLLINVPQSPVKRDSRLCSGGTYSSRF